MNVGMYEYITVWLYITGELDGTDRTCKMGGGLTSQYKHLANFIGDDIIRDK